MVVIGSKIRERRLRLGWSIQKLATLAEIDRGFLSKLETGKAGCSTETLTKLCGAMGVSLGSFFDQRGNVIDAPIGWREIPVLDYARVLKWNASSVPGPKEKQRTIMTELERPLSTFAIELLDNSMEAPVGQGSRWTFLKGDIVVIDPTLIPRPGDFVVATDGVGTVLFRQYREVEPGKDRPVFELFPLNPIHAAVRSDRQGLTLLGTMVEQRRFREA